jgi:hypothetical protein
MSVQLPSSQPQQRGTCSACASTLTYPLTTLMVKCGVCLTTTPSSSISSMSSTSTATGMGSGSGNGGSGIERSLRDQVEQWSVLQVGVFIGVYYSNELYHIIIIDTVWYENDM